MRTITVVRLRERFQKKQLKQIKRGILQLMKFLFLKGITKLKLKFPGKK